MKGIYRFYQQGELIATSENLITTEGKKEILRYLAGQSADIGAAIGLGVGATAAALTDTRLTFEVARASVSIKNADYTNNVVVFKTTLPIESVYTIYEAGLWNNNSNLDSQGESKLLSTFELDTEEWSNGIIDTTATRTSIDSMRVDAAANATTSTRLVVDTDLSMYSGNDLFTIAFNKVNANITSLSLVFENDTGGSFKLTQSISALPVGYNVMTFAKSAFVATGTISWGSITKFGVDVTAGATAGWIILDGIRVEDTDTYSAELILVSRSVLSTPVVKTNVAPMDVEYALEFNVT